MLFNKHNFAIHNFTANNSVRPEINGVFVSPSETVATDSFMLIRVSKQSGDLADYPIIPDKNKPLSNFKPFILPAVQAKEALNIAKKFEKNTLPASRLIVIFKSNEKTAEIGGTDLEASQTINSRITEGKFPDYKQVIPNEQDTIEITLNPAILEKIAKFYKEFNDLDGVKMRVKIKDNELPIRFYAKHRETGQTAEAVLMPIRTTTPAEEQIKNR